MGICRWLWHTNLTITLTTETSIPVLRTQLNPLIAAHTWISLRVGCFRTDLMVISVLPTSVFHIRAENYFWLQKISAIQFCSLLHNLLKSDFSKECDFHCRCSMRRSKTNFFGSNRLFALIGDYLNFMFDWSNNGLNIMRCEIISFHLSPFSKRFHRFLCYR